MSDIQKIVGELAKRAAEEDAEKELERYIKILTAAYSNAKAYNNIIIIAGYAAFFTMWSFTKSLLTEHATLWAALLMTISATTFVVFEVVKMEITSRSIIRMYTAVSEDPSNLLQFIQSLEQKDKIEMQCFLISWKWVVRISLSTGLLAVLIIAASFVIRLLDFYI